MENGIIWIAPMVKPLNMTRQTFRRLRILAGHKQESLAMALGCSVSTISKFERGITKQLYSIDYKALAQELNLTNPINH
jgi:transcriptional regulator with XRE-family HTH domain